MSEISYDGPRHPDWGPRHPRWIFGSFWIGVALALIWYC